MGSFPHSDKEFNVAIIGGGMGGLSLAIGLLRRNINVQIYEAAAAFKEIGLGLSIGPAAHRAMPLIDPHIRKTYDSLVTTHSDSPGFAAFHDTFCEVIWATGDHSEEVLMKLKAPPSGQTSVRRADFLQALVDLIPEEVAHFGKRLTSLEEVDDGVKLQFEDGSSAFADVVVGCDGIKSKVKQHLLSAEELAITAPTYSGMYAYRGVLDMDVAVQAVGEKRARITTWYVGDGAYVITYPIMRAKKVNVGFYKLNDAWVSDTWVRSANKEDMRQDFGHMGKYVNELIKYMPDPSQWAVYVPPAISTFCKSRIAILGDAAHASTPHQGAGAGQAIEDAYILTEMLSDLRVKTPDQVVAAFRAYDAVRRPRSQRVVSTSKENGQLLCLRHDGVGDDPDKLVKTWQDRFRWLWEFDVQGHAEDARSILAEMLQAQG